jgi:predicted ATPase/DNA-binding CsgD family transcriptional regulator
LVVARSHSPAQPTPLLGRTVELETIEQRLVRDDVRLLSLTGPAGVGKTRLALEAGTQLADRFSNGVVLVDLAPVRNADLVLPAIAEALGLTDLGTRPLRERLQEYLEEQKLLLILDNFEQVLPAAGDMAQLLAALPALRIMVTSRVPLHLRWEQTLRIVPLAVPDLDSTLALEDLIQIPSVALFVDRARAQRADFIVTEQHAALLVQLTRQLDGLPLAIELAAANMNVLPLPAIARRLDQRLQRLHWDAHDLPARQRSLHAAIGWSYELLSPSEQRLFRHLGVFAGQASLDAIEMVMGEAEEQQTLDGMVSLAEKSLVLPGRPDDTDPEPTFRMLETMRQYACELLVTHGELEAAARAHVQYFVELAGHADLQLRRSGQQAWYHRLEAEHDNLRAALRWLLDHKEPEQALRLAGALAYFWWLRGYNAEALRWAEEGLRLASDADPAIRIKTLLWAGLLLTYKGHLQQSKALLEAALRLAEEGRDRTASTQSLTYLGLRAAFAGELAEGRRVLQEALQRAEALQDHYQIGIAHSTFGFLAAVQGDPQEAADHDSASLPFGNPASATILQFHQALVLRQPDALPRAVWFLQDGLQTAAALQNRWLLCLGVQATLLLTGDGGDAERRARLMGAGDILMQATGLLPDILERMSGRSLADLRAQLEQQGFGAVHREGRTLQFQEIVTLALSLLEDFSQTLTGVGVPAKEQAPQSPLTARETEVLQWVAEGLTSKRIGQQLFLSPKTVNHHLTSVFNKLGVDSRAQAVAVAARQGLL